MSVFANKAPRFRNRLLNVIYPFVVQCSWVSDMARTIESHHNITFDGKYPVVFCPKYRRKVLVNGVDTRLKEWLSIKAHELQANIVEMEVMPDHVHLLIQCDPQLEIHRVVKQLKGYTSHARNTRVKTVRRQAVRIAKPISP